MKSLIISAASGTGKTTLLKRLFETFPNCFSFSISATTRKPREGEKNGVDYFFLTKEDFIRKISNDDFLEYEEVYGGSYYGTLKSEVERINALGRIAVFDVDVKGGVNIKSKLKDDAVSVFVLPPSIDVLKSRLIGRGTETEDSLNKRISRAEMEISYKDKFDYNIVNDNLDKATEELCKIARNIM